MLFLYSDEWSQKGWGYIAQVKSLHERGLLGPPGGASDCSIILKAKHNEFSDTSMLMPTWLGRATGMTGERSPIHTANEIAERTRDFIKENSKRKLESRESNFVGN